MTDTSFFRGAGERRHYPAIDVGRHLIMSNITRDSISKRRGLRGARDYEAQRI